MPIYNQKFEEAGVLSFGDAAFELLDRMVAPVVAGQGDAVIGEDGDRQ